MKREYYSIKRFLSFFMAVVLLLTAMPSVPSYANDSEIESKTNDYTVEVSSNDVSASDVSTSDVSFGDLSANDLSGDDISTDDISTNDISANDVSTGDISANDVSANDISTNDVSSDDISSNDVSGGENVYDAGDVSGDECSGESSVINDGTESEYKDTAVFDIYVNGEKCRKGLADYSVVLYEATKNKKGKYTLTRVFATDDSAQSGNLIYSIDRSKLYVFELLGSTTDYLTTVAVTLSDENKYTIPEDYSIETTKINKKNYYLLPTDTSKLNQKTGEDKLDFNVRIDLNDNPELYADLSLYADTYACPQLIVNGKIMGEFFQTHGYQVKKGSKVTVKYTTYAYATCTLTNLLANGKKVAKAKNNNISYTFTIKEDTTLVAQYTEKAYLSFLEMTRYDESKNRGTNYYELPLVNSVYYYQLGIWEQRDCDTLSLGVAKRNNDITVEKLTVKCGNKTLNDFTLIKGDSKFRNAYIKCDDWSKYAGKTLTFTIDVKYEETKTQAISWKLYVIPERTTIKLKEKATIDDGKAKTFTVNMGKNAYTEDVKCYVVSHGKEDYLTENYGVLTIDENYKITVPAIMGESKIDLVFAIEGIDEVKRVELTVNSKFRNSAPTVAVTTNDREAKVEVSSNYKFDAAYDRPYEITVTRATVKNKTAPEFDLEKINAQFLDVTVSPDGNSVSFKVDTSEKANNSCEFTIPLIKAEENKGQAWKYTISVYETVYMNGHRIPSKSTSKKVATRNPLVADKLTVKQHMSTLKFVYGVTVADGPVKKIATVKFDAKCTYTDFRVEELDRTGGLVLKREGNEIYAGADVENTKVGAHTIRVTPIGINGEEGKSKDFKITVKGYALNNAYITLQDSGRGLVYKELGKSVKITAKLIIHDDYYEVKASTPKVKWRVYNDYYNEVVKGVSINKKGVVTISKDYVISNSQGGNRFCIVATIDNGYNKPYESHAYFEITNMPERYYEAKIICTNNSSIYDSSKVAISELNRGYMYISCGNNTKQTSEIAYSSSNPSVASIDKYGNITVKKAISQETKITFSAKEKQGEKKTYKVTVSLLPSEKKLSDLAILYDTVVNGLRKDVDSSTVGQIKLPDSDAEFCLYISGEDISQIGVEVKDAKLVKKITGEGQKVVVKPKKAQFSITLTLNGDTATYNFENTDYVSGKAPKASKITVDEKNYEAVKVYLGKQYAGMTVKITQKDYYTSYEKYYVPFFDAFFTSENPYIIDENGYVTFTFRKEQIDFIYINIARFYLSLYGYAPTETVSEYFTIYNQEGQIQGRAKVITFTFKNIP